jgi:hypothetical protein
VPRFLGDASGELLISKILNANDAALFLTETISVEAKRCVEPMGNAVNLLMEPLMCMRIVIVS